MACVRVRVYVEKAWRREVNVLTREFESTGFVRYR